MIFGNIKILKEYAFLDDKIKKCFDYIKNNNLKTYKKGTYPIEGENLFVNIVEYETTTIEERFWEAHRDYLDLHLGLENAERIDLNFIDNMKLGEYIKKDDYQAMTGEKNSSIILSEGNFLICFPNDGHMTGLCYKNPSKIKKAIFKIKI